MGITEKSAEYKYIFGPVLSRRLGISLGVDLVPHKTCTLDCLYCECGKTTDKTLKRAEYVPVDLVKEELKDFLSSGPHLDFITFSGSGEPTLHSGIEEIIKFLKIEYPQYKTALLSNGTLFFMPELRKEILEIDLLKVSIDAGSKENFIKINRPHNELNFLRVIDGLVSLRKGYNKNFLVEFFIMPGINESDGELLKLKKIYNKIKPDSIYLNSIDRPGTKKWIKPASPEVLKRVTECFGKENILPERYLKQHASVPAKAYYKRLLTTIKRRPLTAGEISEMSGINLDDLLIELDNLIKKGEIVKREMPNGIFFVRK